MEITCEKFLELLSSYGTAVNSWEYEFIKKYGGGDDVFSLEHGCAVVVKDCVVDGKGNVYVDIYQTSPDADIALATAEQIEKSKEFFKRCADTNITVTLGVVSNGPLTEEWDKYHGWRIFARQGTEYPADPRVRVLTKSDVPDIKELCKPLLDSSDFFERVEARNFDSAADRFEEYDDHTFYGFYDAEKLCGIASAKQISDLEIVQLADILVLSDYRKRGVGKALVKTALGKFPDKKWMYQAARDNAPSIALAKSLGFTLEGATLMQDVPKE